jgi:hypothetical protein
MLAKVGQIQSGIIKDRQLYSICYLNKANERLLVITSRHQCIHVNKRSSLGRSLSVPLGLLNLDGSTSVADGVVVVLSQLLEGLSGSLLDAEGGEDTEEHEKRHDLQDVVDPWVGVRLGGTPGSERSNGTLADDGTNLAHGSAEAVGSGSVAGREALAGNDESGGVGAFAI